MNLREYKITVDEHAKVLRDIRCLCVDAQTRALGGCTLGVVDLINTAYNRASRFIQTHIEYVSANERDVIDIFSLIDSTNQIINSVRRIDRN